MFRDLDGGELRTYKGSVHEPPGFDEFWRSTLASSKSAGAAPQFADAAIQLETVQTWDVSFSGYGGQPVKAWLQAPRVRRGPLPCVVEFVGYGGGRGLPPQWLQWPSAGYAHMVVDVRGQGSGWRTGDTPDCDPEGSPPHHPGFVTLGITRPERYYYRRVFADAICAIDAARQHDAVDSRRLGVRGTSQGGGIALAAAGLVPDLFFVIVDMPFLCDIPRAVQVAEQPPYTEIGGYLAAHRLHAQAAIDTLSYFDGVNFAKRGRSSALFAVAHMDTTCPPSTVFAAYNSYAGAKQLIEWEYNDHEGGDVFQFMRELEFLAGLLAASAPATG